MINGEEKPQLHGMMFYLVNSLRFYKLRNEKLTPIIFCILLFLGFANSFIPMPESMEGNIPDAEFFGFPALITIGFSLIYLAISMYALAAYTFAFIRDIKREEYSIATCLSFVFKSFFKIMGSSIVYNIIIFIAAIVILLSLMFLPLIIFIVPMIILYFIYLFYLCYIADKGTSIFVAFKSSQNATLGKKVYIFSVFLGFTVFFMIPLMMATYIEGRLVMNFVVSFISTIFIIAQQRLTALLYIDLEYKGSFTKPQN